MEKNIIEKKNTELFGKCMPSYMCHETNIMFLSPVVDICVLELTSD